MFNEELCKIYTPSAITIMRAIAHELENAGRKAIACFPETYKGFTVPGKIFVDGDHMDMYDAFERITYDNFSTDILMREEYPAPLPGDMELYKDSYGGISLWV